VASGPALWQLTASELRERYVAGSLSPVEVVDAILDRIELVNPALNAYVLITPDLARSQARAAESLFARRDGSHVHLPLLGIPASIKDNLATRGIRTTMGSRLLEHWVPDFDAVVVERLRAAGAVVLGKTNTSEFGWKGDAGNLLFGPTRNPWNRDRSSGGSSGGAAAAVATGLGPIALGTDGAGSLRIPAAFCGVVGYKPAQGVVPVYPNSGIGTLSHHGPIARTVSDIALVLGAVSGPDARDRLSSSTVREDALTREPGNAGLRVAFSPTLGYARVDPKVLGPVRAAVQAFSELGCEVGEVDDVFEDPHDALWTILLAAHASQHAADLDAVRDQIDPGRLAMVEDGRTLSALDLGRARAARGRLYERIGELMASWDVLVTPTMPLTAFPAGLDAPEVLAGEPTSKFFWTPFTYPFNLTGHPAISLPCGLADDGLPVAVQIIGPWRRDDLVLRLAASFEAQRPWQALAPFPPVNAELSPSASAL
jgi:aspartyl-tRNA(Asn)/glutamyl-tRNA(Gln) amidotransferase subunit A